TRKQDQAGTPLDRDRTAAQSDDDETRELNQPGSPDELPEETQPVPEMEATPAVGTKRARETETKPKREGLAPDPKQRLMSEFLTQPK
ncbi:hypothetical protein Ciccas_014330, partial [Cichlidogyrus casuarinus]